MKRATESNVPNSTPTPSGRSIICEELRESLRLDAELTITTPDFERKCRIRVPFWMAQWGQDETASFLDRIAALVEMPGTVFTLETGDLGAESPQRLQRRRVPPLEEVPTPPLAVPDRFSVDIQMPLESGGYIPGEVLEAFTRQGVDFQLYVAHGPDLILPTQVAEFVEFLGSGSPRFGSFAKISHRYAITHKRNSLLGKGVAPYIYFADADVLLPQPAVLRGIAEALHCFTELGAAGASYSQGPYFNSHVGAGSMMFRRADLDRIAPMRGAAFICECSYLDLKLQELGRSPAVPLRSVSAVHLQPSHQQPGTFDARANRERLRPPPDRQRVHCRLDDDGKVDVDLINDLVARYGSSFYLSFDGDEAPAPIASD